MKKYIKLIIGGLFFSFILIFIYQCESDKVLISNPSFDGDYKLKWGNLPNLKDGSDFKLGGFQSIDYISDNEFVFVTDRGPVINEIIGTGEKVNFLAPDFIPEIVRVKLNDNNTIEIIDRHPIKTLQGESVSGLPSRTDVEIVNPELDVAFWGMNPGGVVYNPAGNSYWVAEKYAPSLLEVTGRWGSLGDKGDHANILRRFRPYEGLRRYYAGRVGDGGFAGIDVDTKNRLWMTIEKNLINYPVLFQDGDLVELDSLTLYKDKRRIVRKDPGDAYDMSAIYRVEPESFDGVHPEDVSILGIAVYNDTTCYVTEYGRTGDNVRNLLVKVICSAGAWVSPTSEGLFWEDDENNITHYRTYETLSEADKDSINTQSQGRKISYAAKRKLYDLSLEFSNKPVGLTIIDNHKIAILGEHNYGIKSANIETGDVDIEKEDVIVKVLDLQGL